MNQKPAATVPDSDHDLPRLADTVRRLDGRGVRYAQYAKGAVVLRKGQRCSGAYVVMHGRLRVYTLSPDGNEATLYSIHPGETCVLALNCVFNELLYPAWVEAETASKVAVIPGPFYRGLFESDAAVRDLTVRALSTVVFRLMSELEQRHCYGLEQRLASFLLLRADADGVLRMTQHRIASHLGTTREVIARLLRQFAARRLIETRRNGVLIRRPAALVARFARANHVSSP